MPNDDTHGKWAFGVCCISALVLHTAGVSILNIIYLSVIFMFGTKYVSPDLDINSKPYQRWGILRIFWRPYTDYVPHRGMLSHNIVIGPIVLCLWLTLVVAIVIGFFMVFWLPVIEPAIDGAQKIITQIVELDPTVSTIKMFAVFYGVVMASQAFHIILDKVMKGDRQA